MSKLWNGNKAALSLTFDDGLLCQAEHAIPLLERYGMRGTFFLVAKNLWRGTDLWRSAAKRGHEIGSHSFGHFKPRLVTTEEGRRSELVLSKEAIEKELGVTVESYAYPYALADEPMIDAARKVYKQARGGHNSPGPEFLKPGDKEVNMYFTRAQNTCAGNISDVGKWVASALAAGGWLTLMLHGVGPDDTQFDNVETSVFAEALSVVRDFQGKSLWVAPYGTVAQSMRDNS